MWSHPTKLWLGLRTRKNITPARLRKKVGWVRVRVRVRMKTMVRVKGRVSLVFGLGFGCGCGFGSR